MSKYGVFSGPYFPVFSLNTGKMGTRTQEKLRIWTLFTQCCAQKLIKLQISSIVPNPLSNVGMVITVIAESANIRHQDNRLSQKQNKINS